MTRGAAASGPGGGVEDVSCEEDGAGATLGDEDGAGARAGVGEGAGATAGVGEGGNCTSAVEVSFGVSGTA